MTERAGGSFHPGRGWPATVLLVAAAWLFLCAAVVGVGLLLTHPLTRSVGVLDDDLARWFADRRTPMLNDLADIGTLLGETVTGLVVLGAVALGFSLRQRSAAPAFFAGFVYAGLGGIYLVATLLVPRERPPVTILDAGLVPDHSFPSGHVGTAAAIAGCIAVLTWTYASGGRWWWTTPLLLLPLLTLLSRLYQGAHHLTDVLTSLVCAGLWLGAVAVLVLPDERPWSRDVRRTDARSARGPRPSPRR
jgi:undecaprenyl-diphosphatase